MKFRIYYATQDKEIVDAKEVKDITIYSTGNGKYYYQLHNLSSITSSLEERISDITKEKKY